MASNIAHAVVSHLYAARCLQPSNDDFPLLGRGSDDAKHIARSPTKRFSSTRSIRPVLAVLRSNERGRADRPLIIMGSSP